MLGSENQKFIYRSMAVVPRAASHFMATRYLGRRVEPELEERALAGVFARHPLLRARFRESERGVEIDIAETADMSHCVFFDFVDSVKSERAVEIATEFAARRIDPSREPSLQFKFIGGRDGSIAVAIIHHVVVDARSGVIVRSQFQALRDRPVDGVALPSATYADFVRWERALLESQEGAQRLARLRAHLGDYRPLVLNGERERTPGHPGMGLSALQLLDASQSATMIEFIERHGAKPFDLWSSMYAILLSVWTGRDDVGMATPFAVNQLSGFDDVVGNMVDYLPIRLRVEPGKRFVDLLREAVREKNRARADFVPFGALCATTGWDPLSIPRPFQQAILSYEPSSLPRLLIAPDDDISSQVDVHAEALGLRVNTVPLELQDIGLLVTYFRGRLRWRLSGRRDLMDQPELETRGRCLMRLFEAVLQDPDVTVAQLQDRIAR